MQRNGKRTKVRFRRESCDVWGTFAERQEAKARWKSGLKERASVVERLLGMSPENRLPTPDPDDPERP